MILRKNILFAFAVFFVGLSAVFAQTYKEVKADLSLADSKGAVFNEFRSGNISNDGKKFLANYYFARWTMRSNAKDLHKYRAELIADADALPDSAKKVFIPAATKFLSTYARTNEYYPACRFNAILAIGEFNQSKDANNIPVPYANVLKGLCVLADSNDFQLPDYVRLGAIIGLVRHAELGIKDEQQKNTVINIFLSILTSKYAQEKALRPELHTWFELKAIEGLSKFKSPKGPKSPSDIIDALKIIIDNTKADLEVRSLAARAIGTMNLTDLKKYDYIALSKSLVQLARNFYTEEISFIDTENLRDQIKKGGTGTMGAMGGMGGGEMGADPMMSAAPPEAMMGPSMGMSAGTSSMSEEDIAKTNNIISRIKFDFEAISSAIVGVNGKGGIRPMVGQDQREILEMLDKTIQELKNQENFLNFGRDADGEIATKSQGRKGGGKKGVALPPPVSIVEIKDFLNEQIIHFNDLIGSN